MDAPPTLTLTLMMMIVVIMMMIVMIVAGRVGAPPTLRMSGTKVRTLAMMIDDINNEHYFMMIFKRRTM